MQVAQSVLDAAFAHPLAVAAATVAGAAFLYWLSSSSTPSRRKATPLVKDPKVRDFVFI
jgi:hypothetical protein